MGRSTTVEITKEYQSHKLALIALKSTTVEITKEYQSSWQGNLPIQSTTVEITKEYQSTRRTSMATESTIVEITKEYQSLALLNCSKATDNSLLFLGKSSIKYTINTPYLQCL